MATTNGPVGQPFEDEVIALCGNNATALFPTDPCASGAVIMRYLRIACFVVGSRVAVLDEHFVVALMLAAYVADADGMKIRSF
jgi:hypothetical protein